MSTEFAESTFHLIERARQGDHDALERLFTRHLKPLQRWAQGRLPKCLADTDDLVQETLAHTFTRLENFETRGVDALRAYLRQAVANRIRDELRSSEWAKQSGVWWISLSGGEPTLVLRFPPDTPWGGEWTVNRKGSTG